MEHNETLLNISDDESEFSDGYFNSDTESFQESKSEKEPNESEKEPHESEKEYNKMEVSKRKIFTRMNSAYKIDFEKIDNKYTKQNSDDQDDLEQYFYYDQNIEISEKGHGKDHSHSKKNIEKQNHVVIKNKHEKSENISEVSTQINSINQNNTVFNFPSSNRDRSTTSAETAPHKTEQYDKFKQSRTSILISNYDKPAPGQVKRSSKQKQQESTSNINEDISDHPSTAKQKNFSRRQSINDKAKLKLLSHVQTLKQKETKEGVQFEQILTQLQQILTQNHQNQIQGNQHKDDHKNQNEINQYDIFYFFDKMKQFVKYKPRYNVLSVLSRFNQLQDLKRKTIRTRKHHRLSRKKNTQLSKFQKLNQENSLADSRIYSKIMQNSSKIQQNTNPLRETIDNFKFNNSIKKCESDEDPLREFNFQQNDSILNDKDDQNNLNSTNNKYPNQSNSNSKLFTSFDKVPKPLDQAKRQKSGSQSFDNDSYITNKYNNKEEIVSDSQHSDNDIAIQVLPYSFQQLSSNIPERQKLDSM